MNFYKHFFDTGTKLEIGGVNTKQNIFGDDKVKGDDEAFHKANIALYAWPWDK